MMSLGRTCLSIGLVAAQLAALLYLAWTGPVIARTLPLFLTQLVSVFIGLAALWRMGGSPWRIRPDPHPRARLITRGIYRRLRHPMYSSVLLMALTWIYLSHTDDRIAAFFLLFFTLLIKLLYEERALRARFGKDYETYVRHSYRLIPHIF